MPAPLSSRRVLLVSFLVNVFDVLSNLVVAWLTGSAVVFSEMAKGLADSSGSALLVIGERRAKRPRDAEHPLGYAREAFFWGLLSAVAMLVIGGGLSAWRGYQQLVDPTPLEMPVLALAVVALAVLTNGYAVSLSVRKLVHEDGSLRAAFRNMDRPLVKSALLRDAIGTFTSVVGLIALALYQVLDLLIFDALGALVAAVLMVIASLMLMAQARALIAGQALPKGTLRKLRMVVLATPGVEAVNYLAAIYSGASQVLVDADLDLDEDLDTVEIEALLDLIENRIRAVVPDTERVRVNLNSPTSPLR
ncbi:MAG: cation diffusion facilitator family transporter [Gammaproteobacteria bacterium]|nr:cation diffusion facilitator family transporter [Gammaproteobacteria bacterium]